MWHSARRRLSFQSQACKIIMHTVTVAACCFDRLSQVSWAGGWAIQIRFKYVHTYTTYLHTLVIRATQSSRTASTALSRFPLLKGGRMLYIRLLLICNLLGSEPSRMFTLTQTYRRFSRAVQGRPLRFKSHRQEPSVGQTTRYVAVCCKYMILQTQLCTITGTQGSNDRSNAILWMRSFQSIVLACIGTEWRSLGSNHCLA